MANDRYVANQAAKILGTSSQRETISAVLQEVINARRRRAAAAFLAKPGLFDREVIERDQAWGGDE